MGRVAPNRQEAQGLKTSVNKRKQQGTVLIRGIIIGMLFGLVVAFGALGGLSLLMGLPVDQHVLLVDEGGGRGGLSAMDAVLDANRVTSISTEFSVGELINPNSRTAIYPRLVPR